MLYIYARVQFIRDTDANGNLEDNTDFTSFYFASILFISAEMMETDLWDRQTLNTH